MLLEIMCSSNGATAETSDLYALYTAVAKSTFILSNESFQTCVTLIKLLPATDCLCLCPWKKQHTEVRQVNQLQKEWQEIICRLQIGSRQFQQNKECRCRLKPSPSVDRRGKRSYLTMKQLFCTSPIKPTMPWHVLSLALWLQFQSVCERRTTQAKDS